MQYCCASRSLLARTQSVWRGCYICEFPCRQRLHCPTAKHICRELRWWRELGRERVSWRTRPHRPPRSNSGYIGQLTVRLRRGGVALNYASLLANRRNTNAAQVGKPYVPYHVAAKTPRNEPTPFFPSHRRRLHDSLESNALI